MPDVEPAELGRRLAPLVGAAAIEDLVRLSGGASRDTWSFVAIAPDGGRRPLILQRQRAGAERDMAVEQAALRAAASAGVPVPRLVAAGDADALGAPFSVVEWVDGESIARRILREDEYAAARRALPGQLGRALAALHRTDPAAVPGLDATDQLARYREVLDLSGQAHPAFELAFRWLEANRPVPSTPPRIVHGDFRLGNVIVGPEGLRAVLDWELVHLGDPMEDLGWLCVRAWRFGASKPVAGVGEYAELFDAYAAASGHPVDADVVRWWEVLGTLKWGIMCIMQAGAHLSGVVRSHELAAIGRRVCENEHDLLLLLP
jgi:aminoglycoside phosphotransferase (APT) family kinase protein